jgi:hypothetical protein
MQANTSHRSSLPQVEASAPQHSWHAPSQQTSPVPQGGHAAHVF